VIIIVAATIDFGGFAFSWLVDGRAVSAIGAAGLALALVLPACLWIKCPQRRGWMLPLLAAGLTLPLWSGLVSMAFGERLASTGIIIALATGALIGLAFADPIMGGLVSIAIVPAWLLGLLTEVLVHVEHASVTPGRHAPPELALAWWAAMVCAIAGVWAASARRPRRARAGHPVCWRCGYSLAGLMGPVCPECGASRIDA
jgi:hypothetical protein